MIRRTSPLGLDGVVALRGEIRPCDAGWVDGARATWRERTIFDCLRLLSDEQGLELLELGLQQRWITVSDLDELTHQQVGIKGIGQVRRHLARIRGGERSAGERRLTALLREAGISGWQSNVPIQDGSQVIAIGDVVFPRLRLIIEVDGWAFHIDRHMFQRDRSRQNRLVAAGWTVLRFTWRDLTERPAEVIATVRALIGA
jgi:very-short-patch-repair endonuclease